MQESTLARQLLNAALAYAASAGAARIRSLRGWASEAEALSPEALRAHFQTHAKGTPAEGARVEIDARRVKVRCASCDSIFEPDRSVAFCSHCGSARVELLDRPGAGFDHIELA